MYVTNNGLHILYPHLNTPPSLYQHPAQTPSPSNSSNLRKQIAPRIQNPILPPHSPARGTREGCNKYNPHSVVDSNV